MILLLISDAAIMFCWWEAYVHPKYPWTPIAASIWFALLLILNFGLYRKFEGKDDRKDKV